MKIIIEIREPVVDTQDPEIMERMLYNNMRRMFSILDGHVIHKLVSVAGEAHEFGEAVWNDKREDFVITVKAIK